MNTSLTINKTESGNSCVEAPLQDDPGTNQTSSTPTATASLNWQRAVPHVLRTLGAGAVVASMSMFMLQGWEFGDDTNRYFLLLAQTLLMTAGGFALSYGLKENKGARLFLGLALLSVTANFTTLGALIFSQVQWLGELVSYSDAARWQSNDELGMIAAVLAGFLLLTPVSAFAFRLFSGPESRRFTASYIMINCLLLLPMRSSGSAILLALIGVGIAIATIRSLNKETLQLRTPAGHFAKALLFAPAMLIMARSLLLYQVDALFVLALSSFAWFTIRTISLSLSNDSLRRMTLNVASFPLAVCIAANAADVSHSVFGTYNSSLLLGMVFAGLCYELSLRFPQAEGLARAIGNVALTIGILTFLVDSQSMLSSLSGAFVALFAAGIVKQHEHKKLLWLNLVTAGIAFLAFLSELTEWIDLGQWETMGALGAASIVIASLFERGYLSLPRRAGEASTSTSTST